MADNFQKLYWDSSCFLCFLNKTETDRRAICEDVLNHARIKAIHLYTSTYTIAEVIGLRARAFLGLVSSQKKK